MDHLLLTVTDSGLYCGAGDFYIDPWGPVEQALITHGHADHARSGMGSYLTVSRGAEILRARVGDEAQISTVAYGESTRLGDATVSFHPAGHILGSSQIRIESRGLVWVVSGDYKTAPDSTCERFEPLRCHGFVTEATFALPIYRWKPQEDSFAEINDWWKSNRAEGKASILYGYALGKAQRMLAGIDATIGPIFTHGAVERLTQIYRNSGVQLPPTQYAMTAAKKGFAGSLILAPPSANGSPWIRRFGDYSTALASGWMQIRGARRRRAIDRGFVLSDHADWPGLLDAIRATSAQTIWVTHGQTQPLVRVLTEQGLEARAIQTEFEGEFDEQETSSLDADETAEA
jgi:putative mRNA 3-end processing factor